jgi:hypothetical protein
MRFDKIRKLAVVATLSVGLVGAAAGPVFAAASAPQRPAATTATAAVPAAQQGAMTSTITGSFTDATGKPGSVNGTFTPTSFAQQGNQVVATGTLVANLVNSAGQQVGSTSRTVTVPLVLPSQSAVGSSAITCQVLDLVLGPLNLNLLGLVVHLDTVHLNITAVPGVGNLLGNLLCAVAGLLDGPGGLSQLVADLNAILGLLGL